MQGSIYILGDDGALTAVSEQAYDSEALLQELLARCPNLLAGEQMDRVNPRRWLLVQREAPLAAAMDGGARWSVDHLFLDQDAVPTIVEVKRSTDTRIRREVVGQMLDYAANAVAFWPVERLRAAFEARCAEDGEDAEAVLDAHLEASASPDGFWQQVRTNLQAGRVRMLFVADLIPPELLRIIEFLNRQMQPAEVLAVEVRQFVGEGLKALVPTVVGQTEEARQQRSPSASGEQAWTEEAFFEDITRRNGRDVAAVALRVLEWSRQRGLRIWWGRGKKDGSFIPLVDVGGDGHQFICVWTYGRVEIRFQHMRAPLSDPAAREELRQAIGKIVSTDLPADRINQRPAFPLKDLTDAVKLSRFLGVLDGVVARIRDSADAGSV